MTWSDPNQGKDESMHSLGSGVFNAAGVQVVGSCGSSYISDVIKVDRNGVRSAVKILTPGATQDPEIVSRFLTNARYNQGLGEFTGMKISEIVENGPRPYYVMEKVTESSLLEVIRLHAPIDPLWLARLLVPVASMLDTIHQRNLLHANIKPSNLLVSVENNEEKLLLVDFLEPSLMATSATLTGAGIYAAPEFRAGTPVSNRADIYSLAAVMYEAFSGNVPRSAYRKADGSFHVWRNGDQVTPLNQVNPEISSPVSDVIMQSIAPQAVARPASASAMVSDVLRHLEQPRTRVKVGKVEQEKSPVPMLFIGVGVFVAIIMLFGAFKLVTSIFSGSNSGTPTTIATTIPNESSTAPINVEPNGTEKAFLAILPQGSTTCVPDRSVGTAKKWTEANAIVRCNIAEIDSLSYGAFDNATVLDATYQQQAVDFGEQVKAQNSNIVKGAPGVAPCSVNANESGEWGSKGKGGKYTCVTFPSPRIVWTERNSAVIGDAFIDTGSMSELIEWWKFKSGPL